MERVLAFIFSPTYLWADYNKRKLRTSEQAIGNLIREYNTRYLVFSTLMAGAFGLWWDDSLHSSKYSSACSIFIFFVIWIFPLSRANEVCYAFLKDAIAKVNGEPSSSDLRYGERIKLALKSYIELILDFAILFYILPHEWFNGSFNSLMDAIYFSGVTITTLGYGDISPVHIIPRLLVVYEVLCGFTLIVVSFTIYTGRGLGPTNS